MPLRVIRVLKPLVYQGRSLSLGRIAFIILFAKIAFFCGAVAISSEVVTLLLGLLAYNVGSKVFSKSDTSEQ